MNATEFLALIGRNEIEKLGTGEKTGEYLITPAELEEYAEINQRDAFEAEIRISAQYETNEDGRYHVTIDDMFNQWKEANQ